MKHQTSNIKQPIDKRKINQSKSKTRGKLKVSIYIISIYFYLFFFLFNKVSDYVIYDANFLFLLFFIFFY